MARLILITFMLLSFIPQIEVYAEPIKATVTIPMQKSPSNGDRDDDQRNDKRLPPAPIHCTIDFVNQTVSGFNDTIIVYEVCDIETGYTTASFLNEFDFVEFLITYDGTTMIRLSSDNYTYLGYISL